MSGNDFYAGQTASIGRTRQVNSDRIKRNTQIFDLWKAAVKIREPLAQRYLATVRRCTFAYEISPARKAGDEREYQFIEYRNGYKNGIIMLFMI
ncbi:hypothetical protein [Butyricimonas virosa]|uniref:hypothetical protein n=2 Tax=Bacteroidales TaxID=171549 RepID=UPI0004DA9978